MNTNESDQDFIAIQPGNIISESMVESSPINTQFNFNVSEIVNDKIFVDVKASEFTSVHGFQFGLKLLPKRTETRRKYGANGARLGQYSPSLAKATFLADYSSHLLIKTNNSEIEQCALGKT